MTDRLHEGMAQVEGFVKGEVIGQLKTKTKTKGRFLERLKQTSHSLYG
jgi:hypothetical protein